MATILHRKSVLQKILNISASCSKNGQYLSRGRNTFTFRYYSQERTAKNDRTLFFRAREFQDRTAIIDKNGEYSYKQLLKLSGVLSQKISEACSKKGEEDLEGKKIAFLCSRDLSYVAVQWAIWRRGGIAVPLSPSYPTNMIEYFIEDSDSTLLVTTQEYSGKIQPLIEKKKNFHLEVSNDGGTQVSEEGLHPTAKEMEVIEWDDKGAMLFYTSGTTGKPKGVLTTHGNIRAQICGMVTAWGWTENDCILHVLPLHHVHGVINVLSCSLWVGATCVMLHDFHPKEVWQYLITAGSSPCLSLFMAVPTIYSKLIDHYKDCKHSQEMKDHIRTMCSNLRLMVSGSSALPEPTMKEWYEISGHLLLERYGMTEIGMALSNPLHGPRIAGSVGTPLPGVEVRIVAKDDQGKELDNQVIVEGDEHGSKLLQPELEYYRGALQVRGPSVFKSYWRKPLASKESFTNDHWFRTGDYAEYKDGIYKILGRSSVDIIKSGGYKISALDIERELLAHPSIKDCAVVGAPDPTWGERVAALVSLHPDKNLTLQELREWVSDRLSHYQSPSLLKLTDELPRNAMGKVNKKELIKIFFAD